MQPEKEQYDSCNANAGSGDFLFNGFCTNLTSKLRLELRENNQQLASAVNFENDHKYYLTSE